MTGTPSQIEWAEQIKRQVNAEFDRVANAFKSRPTDSRNRIDWISTQSSQSWNKSALK